MSLRVQRSSLASFVSSLIKRNIGTSSATKQEDRSLNTQEVNHSALSRSNAKMGLGFIPLFLLSTLFLLTGRSPGKDSKTTQAPPSLPSITSIQTPVSKDNYQFLDGGKTVVLTIDLDEYEANIVKARDHASSTESLSSMINRFDAVAGTNLSFFDLSTRSTIGIEIVDSEVVFWNSGEYWQRPIFYTDKNNHAYFYRPVEPPHLYFEIDGNKFPVNQVNSRGNANETLVYNHYYPYKYISSSPDQINIVVRNGTVSKLMSGSTEIPKDGYVVSLSKNAREQFEKLYDPNKTQRVALTHNLPSNIEDAATLGSTLIEKGIILTKKPGEKTSSYVQKRHTRTGIGIDEVENKIVLIASRRPRTLEELAWLFKKLGIKEACNADGGSSTSIAFLKSNSAWYVRNGRPVVNSLIINP